MDVSIFYVAVLLLVGHATSLDVPSSLWQPGREVVYKYQAAVKTWTLIPVETASQWQLRAKVKVQGDVNKATLQVSDVEVGVHNGAKEDGEPTDMTWGPAPEEAQHLLNPFSIQYTSEQPGHIGELLVKAGEDPWVINMKRGLANLLQLDLSKVNKPASYNMEDGLHGRCSVMYLVEEDRDGHPRVRKHVDHTKCVNFVSKYRGSDEQLHCHNKASLPQDRISDSVVMYELGDKPFIKNVHAHGGISLQMFRATIEHHRIVTSQNLTLVEEREVTEPLVVKDGGEKMLAQFEMPDKDITSGRARVSQEEQLAMGLKTLERLSSNLEQNHLEVKPENLHEEQIAWVLYVLSTMEQPTLRKLYITLEGSQGHRFKQVRSLFMQLLPQIGSHDAALLLRDLVVAKSVKNVTAIRLVYALALYIRDPTPELVQDLQVLVDDTHLGPAVHQTAVLSFATIVGKMCRTSCPVDILEKYVKKYVEQVTDNKDNYSKQMLYLQGLGNMEHYKVMEHLKPLISDHSQSHYVRHHAIWATKSVVKGHPVETYELYMPILRNHSEILELRAAALKLLMISSPTVSRLSDIMWFMEHEEDPQLQNYWYTSLKSVAHSRHPCFTELAEAARRVVRSVQEPQVEWWASASYLLDYSNPEYDFGAAMHMSTVTNPRTGLPNTLYFTYWAYEGQIRFADFGVAVRLEGFSDHLRNMLLNRLPKNMPKLKEVLNSLNLPKVSSDPLHFEISVMLRGKVIQTYYIDTKNINEVMQGMVEPLMELQDKGMDYHLIDIDMLLNHGEQLATDVGTLAVTGTVFSGVGVYNIFSNITAVPADSVLPGSLHRIIDLRYLVHGQSSLTTYNPVLNLWNVVKKSRSIQTKLPLEYFQTNQNGTDLTWTFQQTPGKEAGVVWHVQTLSTVRGYKADEELKKYCPTCSSRVIVHSGDALPQEQPLIRFEEPGVGGVEVSLPQCENEKDQEDMLLSLLDEVDEYVNAEVLPGGELALMMLHTIDIFLLGPSTGSCGVAVKVFPPAQPAQVELKIRMLTEKGPEEKTPKVEILLGHKEPGSAKVNPWIEAVLRAQGEKTTDIITMDVILPENHKVCSILKVTRPDVSITPVVFSERNDGIKALFGLKWGVIDECKQDDSTEVNFLEVAVLAERSEKQMALLKEHNEGVYAQCWKDIDGKPRQDIPYTAACTEVYNEQNTFRHFHVIVSHKNFMLVPYLQVPWVLYELGDPEPRNLSAQGEFEMTLDFPAGENAILKTKYYEVTLDDDTSEMVEPWFIENQEVWNHDPITHLPFHGSCMVNVDGVRTYDSANNTEHISPCYTLATTDCLKGQESHFAVFVKKVEDKLGMKIYLFNDEVELVPGADKPVILVNGTAVDTPHFEKLLSISMSGDESHAVRVASHGLMYLNVAYTGKSAEVTTPILFRGSLCGICGNYDGNSHNDNTHQYQLECGGAPAAR